MDETFSTHGEILTAYKFELESLKGRNQSEDLSVEGRIILKFILKE
jgi:hypothetical protein